MTSRSKTLAFGALVLALFAGAAVWFLMGRGASPSEEAARSSETGGVAGEAGSQADGAPVATPIVEVADAAEAEGSLGPIYDRVDTFGGLTSALATSEVSDAQKLEYLRQSAVFCENFASARLQPPNPRLKLTPSELQSQELAKAHADRFCSDFTGSSGDFASRLSVLSADGDVLAAQTLTDLGASGEAAPLAEEILATTSDPSAFLTAANYLVGTGQARWDVERLTAAERALDDAGLARARQLSAKMLMCEYSGGCEAGGMTSMVECGNVGACRPGIAAEDVWRAKYSEAENSLAKRLRDELKQIRERAGEG